MRRVFRVKGQRRFYGICCLGFFVFILGFLTLGSLFIEKVSVLETLFFALLVVIASVLVILELLVLRVVADDIGLQSYDMLNRIKVECGFEEITSYAREVPGGWTVRAGEKMIRVHKMEKQEFHALMAEKAPRALHAKLWKCGQIPPSEDYTGLSLFNWRMWFDRLAAAGLFSGIIWFLSRWYAVGYFISSFVQNSYYLKDLLGRLEMNGSGVTSRWPWSWQAVSWDELTAVFCERGPDGFSSFVLTAPGRSVWVPSHILADPEVRRKFFYSIPDFTRCVNFDKMRFRGRGRGKKLRAEEPMGSLEPFPSL